MVLIRFAAAAPTSRSGQEEGENPPSAQGSGPRALRGFLPGLPPPACAGVVQTGCPSATVVLDGFPPFIIGLSPPFRRKTPRRFADRDIVITRPASPAADQRPGLFRITISLDQTFSNLRFAPPEQSGDASGGGLDSMTGSQPSRARNPGLLGGLPLFVPNGCLAHFCVQASSLCAA